MLFPLVSRAQELCALLASSFQEQERLRDDVLVRQSLPVEQQSFIAILQGSCEVLRH